MTQPSNLKVKRLVELPLLPPEQADVAQTYAVVDSVDYKLNVDVLVDAAAAGVYDEVLDILSPVATSNSYDDLDDKPFIPQNSDQLPQGTTNLYATAAEKTKLSGIEEGAQVNSVTSVAGKTGAVTLTAADAGAEPAFSKGSIIQGEGVNIAGVLTDRLVGTGDITITATGEGGGVVVEVVAGTGIDVDDTDVASPIVALSSAAQASLDLADSSVQPADLSAVATTGAYSDLSGTPTGSTSVVLSGGQWQRAAVAGDVTISANSNTSTIANRAVTNAKMADMTEATIKGRASAAGTGVPTDLSAAQVRTILNVANGATANTGTVTSVNLGNSTGLTASGGPITTSGTLTYTLSSNLQGWHGVAPSSKANVSGQVFTGGVQAPFFTADLDNFVSSSTTANLATTGAGTVHLRPNGAASATGQLAVSTSSISWNGSTLWHAGNLAVGTSGNAVGKLNTSNTWAESQTYGNGIRFGSQIVAAGTDVSKHISLYGSSYGITVTSGTMNFVTDAVVRLTISTSGATSTGGLFDSSGDVRKLSVTTANSTVNLSAANLNKAVEKSNTTAYTYTIPSGMGSQGDAITLVNSGTAGNLTIARGAGVAIYRNGVDANITVVPGSMITIYRSATANRWIA